MTGGELAPARRRPNVYFSRWSGRTRLEPAGETYHPPVKVEPMSIYDFPLQDPRGRAEFAAPIRGETLLIVNVASKCGLTPQYEGLETAAGALPDRGFTSWASRATSSASKSPVPPRRSRRSARRPTASLPALREDRRQRRQPAPHLRRAREGARRRRATRATCAGTSRSSWSRATASVMRFAPQVTPEDPTLARRHRDGPRLTRADRAV